MTGAAAVPAAVPRDDRRAGTTAAPVTRHHDLTVGSTSHFEWPASSSTDTDNEAAGLYGETQTIAG